MRNNGNVSELTVVSAAHGVEAEEIERVRIHVVASLKGNDRGVVPRIDQTEIVGAHASKTGSVFVNERGIEDRVDSASRVEGESVTDVARAGAGVVGPFTRYSLVADSKEESLDTVGETDVVAGLSILVGDIRLDGGSLNLFNEDITGCAGHAFTFIRRNNGVRGPNLDALKLGFASSEPRSLSTSAPARAGAGVGTVVNNEEFTPVTETERDTNVIVRESGSGESYTAITRVEEGERKIESNRGDGSASGSGLNKFVNVTNHVVVTSALASGDSEGTPEIKMVIIETSSNKVVESNRSFADKIVHEVTSPTEVTIGTSVWVTRGERDRGDGDTEPRVDKVVTSTRNGNTPFLTELGLTRRATEYYGHNSEPGGLASFTHKVRNSVGTTV